MIRTCVVVVVISAGLMNAQEFAPKKVAPAFDAITDPNIIPADQSGDWVRDDELVLGVEIEGETRAYPINMLTRPTREIINDKLGGRSIAATW